MSLQSKLLTGRRLALGDAPSMLKHVSGYRTLLRVQDIGSQCSDNDPDVLHAEKEKVLKGDMLSVDLLEEN